MKVQIKLFNQLTTQELYDILYLRNLVFVVEQNCVYLDTDLTDAKAHHISIYNNDNFLVAYCRIFDKGIKYATTSIGRVVVHPNFRGLKLGHDLIKEAINAIKTLYGCSEITISAQAHLQNFYKHHGFLTVSDLYLEDDIPHVEMLRK